MTTEQRSAREPPPTSRRWKRNRCLHTTARRRAPAHDAHPGVACRAPVDETRHESAPHCLQCHGDLAHIRSPRASACRRCSTSNVTLPAIACWPNRWSPTGRRRPHRAGRCQLRGVIAKYVDHLPLYRQQTIRPQRRRAVAPTLPSGRSSAWLCNRWLIDWLHREQAIACR